MLAPVTILALALSASATTPARIQLVLQADSPALGGAARRLQALLDDEPQVTVAADVIVPAAAAGGVEPDPPPGEVILRAQAHYQSLEAELALAGVVAAAASLGARLDQAGAPALLAQALRLEGLTLLYVERAEEAAKSFASASFLEPEFSPAAEEWPPEARLAYADAVAASRRAQPGALSIQVSPDAARVWLDGREVGLGSTTVTGLHPGEHYLFVTCPGHESFSGRVALGGGGKLAHAPVFLELHPGVDAAAVAAAMLASRLGQEDERVAARQAARLWQADAIVVVGADPLGEAAVAWLLDADGRRVGGALSLVRPEQVAAALVARIAGTPSSPPSIIEAPWYRTWWVWAAAGAALAGGGAGAYLLLRPEEPRGSFYLEGKQ